jgi:hypothetical protein
MKMRWGVFVSIVSLVIIYACEREVLFRGKGPGIRFSTEMILFDTVFTSIGKSTKTFRIYNPHNEDVAISVIQLAGGKRSNFHISVDGYPDDNLRDVNIPGLDSLMVFVEVSIDPVGSDLPFLVSDSILFFSNNQMQCVKLMAYAQDVVLLRKEWLKTQTLTRDKPYLIYDYIVVDSLHTLTIEAGARLHFHRNASMLVLGTLKANGTRENPIIFEDDRLEEAYNDVPGQWGYLQFFPSSKNSSLSYVYIRNGTIGIMADSVSMTSDVPLKITNCRIEHISSIGLLAETSHIEVVNTLFGDCGSHSVALTVGGKYRFYQTTIANGYNWDFRSAPALFMNNYFVDVNKKVQIVPVKQAVFGNCIIYGKNNNEIELDFKVPEGSSLTEVADFYFDHCLVKVDSTFKFFSDRFFNKPLVNLNPAFRDWSRFDYRLDTLSAAKDAGKSILALEWPADVLGNNRLADKAPDLGIFERMEGK